VCERLATFGNGVRVVVRVALGMAKELPLGGVEKAAVAGAEALFGEQEPGQEKTDNTRESATEQVRAAMQELVDMVRLAAARAQGHGGDHPEEDYRVVVVIDDLDRCAPDRMVDMLNWLKVHLSVRGCCYLLALDHGAAARAIVGQYKDYLGDSSDVAYGYRYLEKIVDHEVELSASTLVERMAAQVVADRPSVNAIVESVLGTQGDRLTETGKLVKMSTLQSPRTMLKLVHRFTSALEQVRDREKEKTEDRRAGEQQLPADYPFWLLLLTAMYYRLPPKVIDEFCHDLGDLHRNERPGAGVSSHGETPIGEFRRFLWEELEPSGQATISRLPSQQARQELYAAVRRG
jgi:hypothetical protein